eukprot:SAG11_NODE_2464_length_3326_cov_7.981097_3_plen_592_part_00
MAIVVPPVFVDRAGSIQLGHWGQEGLYLQWRRRGSKWVPLQPMHVEAAHECPNPPPNIARELHEGTVYYAERRSRRWGLASVHGHTARWLRLLDTSTHGELLDADGTLLHQISRDALLPVNGRVDGRKLPARSPRLQQSMLHHEELRRHLGLRCGRVVLTCGSCVLELHRDGPGGVEGGDGRVAQLPTVDVRALQAHHQDESLIAALLVAQHERAAALRALQRRGRSIILSGGCLSDPTAKPTPYGSPHFKRISQALGSTIASRWGEFHRLGFSQMVTGSMAGNAPHETASFDYHCSEGFASWFQETPEQPPLIHFKDQNTVKIGGDVFRVPHGRTVIFETDEGDHSNMVKEGALLSLSERSLVLFGAGGPTVASNMVRLAMLPQSSMGFAICGLHGESRASGSTGALLDHAAFVRALQACRGLVGGTVDGDRMEGRASAAIQCGSVGAALERSLLHDLDGRMTAAGLYGEDSFPPLRRLLSAGPVLNRGFGLATGDADIDRYCARAVDAMLQKLRAESAGGALVFKQPRILNEELIDYSSDRCFFKHKFEQINPWPQVLLGITFCTLSCSQDWSSYVLSNVDEVSNIVTV